MVGQYSDSIQEELIRNDSFQGHTPESLNLELAMRCVREISHITTDFIIQLPFSHITEVCNTTVFFSMQYAKYVSIHNFSLGPLFLCRDLWGGGF